MNGLAGPLPVTGASTSVSWNAFAVRADPERLADGPTDDSESAHEKGSLHPLSSPKPMNNRVCELPLELAELFEVIADFSTYSLNVINTFANSATLDHARRITSTPIKIKTTSLGLHSLRHPK